jgi:hypothetical protein
MILWLSRFGRTKPKRSMFPGIKNGGAGPTRLSHRYLAREYVRLAAGGETVLITDRDRVVAEIVPPQPARSPFLTDALAG